MAKRNGDLKQRSAGIDETGQQSHLVQLQTHFYALELKADISI